MNEVYDIDPTIAYFIEQQVLADYHHPRIRTPKAYRVEPRVDGQYVKRFFYTSAHRHGTLG